MIDVEDLGHDSRGGVCVRPVAGIRQADGHREFGRGVVDACAETDHSSYETAEVLHLCAEDGRAAAGFYLPGKQDVLVAWCFGFEEVIFAGGGQSCVVHAEVLVPLSAEKDMFLFMLVYLATFGEGCGTTFGKYSYKESAQAPRVKVAEGKLGPVVSTVQGHSPGIRVWFCAWSK